ncbi:PR domain zinc finger protein 8 [Halotydeus destructor]|nr:PR domain zinc finger protein 8 [Halotydeus destructor]
MSNLSSTLLTSLQSSQLNGSLTPTTLSHNQSSFLSAFKKVQAKADLLPTSGPTSFDITSLYGSRPLAASQPSLFAGHSQLAYSLMPPPGSLMSPSLSSTTQAPSGHPMKSNGGPSLSQLNQISPSGRPGHDSKSLVAPSLLPFLPPSLAALSFPQTNWCAKCNATFRMTSDLVYHMRSHHKSNTIVDPIKKKREEKLRCNVCGESFRERHHLDSTYD